MSHCKCWMICYSEYPNIQISHSLISFKTTVFLIRKFFMVFIYRDMQFCFYDLNVPFTEEKRRIFFVEKSLGKKTFFSCQINLNLKTISTSSRKYTFHWNQLRISECIYSCKESYYLVYCRTVGNIIGRKHFNF